MAAQDVKKKKEKKESQAPKQHKLLRKKCYIKQGVHV